MDCDQIGEAEIAERYVAGRLSDGEMAEFELHFLSCQRCFREVQLHQDLKAVLARPPRRRMRWAGMLAAAASLLIAAGIARYAMRPGAQHAGPAAAGRVRAGSTQSLLALAAITPPRYAHPGWRSAGQTDFDQAMRRYSSGDYAGAAQGLLAAVKADPANSAARFFLGIAYSMQARNDDAIAQLRATIALGDSPELEDAHFYLAKALLRKQDASAAIDELHRAIALHGPSQQEEETLLERVMEVHPTP